MIRMICRLNEKLKVQTLGLFTKRDELIILQYEDRKGVGSSSFRNTAKIMPQKHRKLLLTIFLRQFSVSTLLDTLYQSNKGSRKHSKQHIPKIFGIFRRFVNNSANGLKNISDGYIIISGKDGIYNGKSEEALVA